MLNYIIIPQLALKQTSIITGLCWINKVLKRINYQVSADDIYDIIASKPGVIEAVLRQIQLKIAQHTLVTDPKKDSVLGSVSDSSSIKGKRFSVGAEKYAAPSKTIGKDKSAKEMSDSYIYKIQEQEDTISELKQTIMLMETKMKKYEEMISIKDDQIREMKIAMEQAGLL